MTARDLLAALAEAGVIVSADGGRLRLGGRPPAHLKPAIVLLKTGLAALALKRTWYGLPADGRAVILNPAGRIPAGVNYLTFEGCRTWDRVPAEAARDLPRAFDPPPVPMKPTRRPAREVTLT